MPKAPKAPLDDLHTDAGRWKPEKSGLLAGARILVVEDEVLIAMEIQATVEDGGAEVVGPFHGLATALVHAGAEDVSAAVLDLRIGRDAVSPVARRLVERGIPFLFYSGQPATDPVRAEWPHVPTLSKPASTGVLLQAIADLLGKHKRPCARN